MKKFIDLTKILTREHEDKWVVLSNDYKKVLGFSDDLVELRDKFGIEKVIYKKVPLSGRSYSF